MCNVELFFESSTKYPFGCAQKINYKGIVPLYIVLVKSMYAIYRYSVKFKV